MDIKHLTSDSLRRLLALTEKKDQLVKAVEDVGNEIAKALKGAATTAVEVAEAVTPFKPKAAKSPKARKAAKATAGKGGGRSSGLKDRILALLEAAGSEGMRVKDIADALGVKAANVSVWFSTTGKKITHKIKPGLFASMDVGSAAAAPTSEPKAPKARKSAKAPKAAKTPKAPKAPKTQKSVWGARKTKATKNK